MSTSRTTKLSVQEYCSIFRGMVLPPYDKKEVGRRIVILRAAHNNISQKDLAGLLKITPTKLWNYESGTNMIPHDTAAALCSITGANFDYLFRSLSGDLSPRLQQAIADAEKKLAEMLA